MNPLELQARVRRNAMEQQTFLGDLLKWEKEASKKDNRLKRSSSSSSSSSVRAGGGSVPVRMTTNTTSSSTTDSLTPYHVPSEPSRSSSSSTPPPPLPSSQRNDRGENEKRLGNQAFQEGAFQQSIVHYTRSLGYFSVEQGKDTVLVALYANRALAHLKLHQHTQAERDARQALHIDPSYTKASLRLSLAYMHQGKLRAALDELLKADSLLPLPCSSAENEKGRRKLEKAIQQQRTKVEEQLRTAIVQAPFIWRLGREEEGQQASFPPSWLNKR